MKLRVIFNTGVGSPAVNLIELEALAYVKDQRDGSLTIMRQAGHAHEPIVVYAAGVWRSVTDVGALNEATAAAKPPQPEAARENPRRPEKARQVRATRLLPRPDTAL